MIYAAMMPTLSCTFLPSSYPPHTLLCISRHSVAIEQIIKNAKCELELETQFYGIEEEWSEQVRVCYGIHCSVS